MTTNQPHRPDKQRSWRANKQSSWDDATFTDLPPAALDAVRQVRNNPDHPLGQLWANMRRNNRRMLTTAFITITTLVVGIVIEPWLAMLFPVFSVATFVFWLKRLQPQSTLTSHHQQMRHLIEMVTQQRVDGERSAAALMADIIEDWPESPYDAKQYVDEQLRRRGLTSDRPTPTPAAPQATRRPTGPSQNENVHPVAAALDLQVDRAVRARHQLDRLTDTADTGPLTQRLTGWTATFDSHIDQIRKHAARGHVLLDAADGNTTSATSTAASDQLQQAEQLVAELHDALATAADIISRAQNNQQHGVSLTDQTAALDAAWRHLTEPTAPQQSDAADDTDEDSGGTPQTATS